MQKQLKDVTDATFSTDRWIVRVIMAAAAGFASLQSSGGIWPWVDATNGTVLDVQTGSYRTVAWLMVILLAWVNWKPNGKPTA